MEQRANIKFCVKLEKKFAETYELIKKVSYSISKKFGYFWDTLCMSEIFIYTI